LSQPKGPYTSPVQMPSIGMLDHSFRAVTA
jgi:hypothetical protein